ncbi:hypothetical protein L9F63_027823, partial [Diploptera punctata]
FNNSMSQIFNSNMLLMCLDVIKQGHKAVTYEANPDAKRLYDDLLSNYNRLIRPVINNTETLTVWLGLKLSQLIEVNLKSQVMTTNLWVQQKWIDYKLRWDPEEYGGVDMLYVPSEHIWLPDIVLYNNADGNYEVTLMTKATLKFTGEVYWKPPAIYKSSCEINVEYFPFDEQSCLMKFGSWTYNGFQLLHMDQQPGSNLVNVGIDLSEFYLSVEWDILEVPARRNEEYYPCCAEPYSEIFKLHIHVKNYSPIFHSFREKLLSSGRVITYQELLLPPSVGGPINLLINSESAGISKFIRFFLFLDVKLKKIKSLDTPLKHLSRYLEVPIFPVSLLDIDVWDVILSDFHSFTLVICKSSALLSKMYKPYFTTKVCPGYTPGTRVYFLPKLVLLTSAILTRPCWPELKIKTPCKHNTQEIQIFTPGVARTRSTSCRSCPEKKIKTS